MATTILDLSGTLPQTFTAGNWPASTFNTATWEFDWTPTAASSSGTWSTGALTYWAIVSTNDANGGGLWLEHNGGILTLMVVSAATGSPISGATLAITWTAGLTMRIRVNQGTGALTVTGATTGGGTASYTPETILSGTSLTVGQWGSGGFTLGASAISDITDGNDASAGAGAASIAVAASATSIAFSRGAGSAAVAVGASAAAGGTSRGAGSASATVAASSVGATTARGAGSASVAVTAAAAGGTGLEWLGDYGAARVLYGTAAGTVTLTLDTAASGSTLILCVGGNLGDLADPPTDSHANTWTLLHEEEYQRWADYGIRVYKCENASGGAGHSFGQEFGQTLGFDECTIAVAEVLAAHYVVDTALTQRLTGQALTVDAVTTNAAAGIVSFFAGDDVTGHTTTIALSPSSNVLIDDSTFVDHPNGYVPIGIIYRKVSGAGSYQWTATEDRDQGAIMVQIAVQAANVSGGAGTAGIAVGAGAEGAATSRGGGGASAVVTASAVGASTARGAGSAAVAVNAAATGSALWRGAGSATIATTGVAIGAATARGAGSAGVTIGAAGAAEATSRGVGAGTAIVSALGAGAATGRGAGTAAITVDAAAPGVALASGTGSATANVTATAGGATTARGAGAAAIVVDALGIGPGAFTSSGAGLASIGVTGAAIGVALARGAGTGSITVATIGSGAAIARGAGSAAIVVDATAESPFVSAGAGSAAIILAAVARAASGLPSEQPGARGATILPRVVASATILD